jgi:hypothetical protein
MTTDQNLLVWMDTLAALALARDLTDADDRALFRGAVDFSMRNCKLSGIREIAAHLGAPKGTSRAAVTRGIADTWIERTTMDPNQALLNARDAARDLRSHIDRGNASPADLVEELVEAFEALDGWISGGGFLPSDWSKNRG